MKKLIVGILFLLLCAPASADDYVYMTVLKRAAPGKLPDLIELL